MGGKASENYRTNLFLENSAYTFEWNHDFTADEKSYCFQGNKHSEVTDCSWLKKKKKKITKATRAEIDAKSIDATWMM